MKNQDLLEGFHDLRRQVETQTGVDPRKGLESRRLVFQAKKIPELADVVLAVEAGLDTFERSIIEKRSRHGVEAARKSFLATLDSMIRRLSPS